MNSSGKVLPFPRPMADSEPLRERCAVRVMETLREGVEKMYLDTLQAGDDALFDRAEKAVNSTQQSDFFDMMRRLRLAKPDLAARALTNCKLEIESCFRLSRANSRSGSGKTSLDDLSLVDPDTIESDIAMSTAAGKSRSKFPREWQQLEARIDGIFAASPTGNESGRRFGPELFVEAFGKAVQNFDCTIEVRLTLIKFVERELLNQTEALLGGAHQALTECGVPQPANTPPVFRPLRAQGSGMAGAGAPGGMPPAAAGAGNAAGDAATGGYAPIGSGELDPTLGRSMQDFLAQLSMPMGGNGGASGGYPAGGMGGYLPAGPSGFQPNPGNSGGPVPEAQMNDVLRALASIDQKFRTMDRNMPVGHDIAAALREQLNQSVAGGQGAQLRPLDAGVIDLISLMFEYAVNDKHLPGALQASIARLQIPYLKLALIDPQFLAKRDHPARRLLDELAQAAVGWNEGNDRGLRQHVDGIVHALVDGFKDDTSVFEKQRQALIEFTRKDGSRTEIAEKRAVQAADGKSKMEAAQRDAAAVLKQKLDGRMLPTSLSSMVRDRWSNYMVLTLLRHGSDSTAWSEAIRLLELIARFPRADAGLDDRTSWGRELDTVEPIMRKGLAATGVHDTDIDEVLSGLHELLRVQSVDAPIVPGEVPVFNDVVPPPRVRLEPVRIDVPVIDAPAPAEDPLAAEIEEIQKLVAGTWIEMEVQPERRERVKLLWVSADKRNYLFVNANGIKVADKKGRELAEDLKAGRIAVLDRKPLVERAFEAAMAKVRQFRAEARKA